MYTRERAAAARAAIAALMRDLLIRAEQHIDWPMPGYTHLQRAQPVYLGHHLLAYFWMLARDRSRFAFAEAESGRLPLGAGALAGGDVETVRRQAAAERLRAKAPRVVGHLAAFHGVMHALPLTYNKDLQEDKEHLFDAVDTIELTLAAATGMIAGVRFDRERMSEAAGDELIAATDVADLLVRLGMPFREAHGVVAGLVRTAVDQGKGLSDLSDGEIAAVSEMLAAHRADSDAVLVQSSWLESKVSEGGTSLERVREQIELARTVLDEGATA